MSHLERFPAIAAPAGASGKPVRFTYDGKAYVGREGDTLAAALLANGVRLVGRSFKLHRPRGLMGSGVEEPNGLVQLESGGYDEPNARATMVPLYEGLSARSQNAWPNVNWDCLSVLGWFQKLLPASFYYKSMMWPSWAFYERFVRPIAGLGRAPTVPDAQVYQKRNLHCDVLVCGGGPAGLSSALAAGQRGLRVVLIDDKEEFGGSLLGESYDIDGKHAIEWVRQVLAQLRALPNVRLLPRTTASGYYENNFVAAAERIANHIGPAAPKALPRERLWRIRAKSVVLATGAIERPLVFPNNDRPGVMLASAVRLYANRYGVVPGRKVVVATNNDNAYRTALDLHRLGIRDIVVVDTRPLISSELRQQMSGTDIELYLGSGIRDVRGRKIINAVEIAKHVGHGNLAGHSKTIPCDLLAVSSGWTPTIHLFSQAGGSLRYDEKHAALVPAECRQQVQVVGAANGSFPINACLHEGRASGESTAARILGAPDNVSPVASPRSSQKDELGIEPYWYTQGGRSDKQWLDFQYDVKVSDIELAMRENFVSVEHVKRYTTGGMSVDQGKSSNFNILAIMAELTGRKIPEVGTTRFRPPFQPVTIGTFAGPTLGERYAPWGELPAKAWHEKRGAHFGDYGFKRPEYYPRAGEDIVSATRREVHAVRNGVGMFDGSPLGKIEVKGPDAARFLNRAYVNNIGTLKLDSARYAMMTNENGVLIDDGVIVRLAEDHFLVHATSGAVGRVFMLLEEYLQCDWPDLNVHVNNMTSQWANVTVSGPRARAVMDKLDTDIDFSPEKFGHMQFRSGTLAGVPVRILRASFTGEATYEVSVPARYGLSLWEMLEEAGAAFGIVPYGIEALEVLRTEKGYIHIGSDTDGSTNPLDIGWAHIIEKKTEDFIGRRSLQRSQDRRSDRLQYVGLEPVDPQEKLRVGGHIISESKPSIPVKSEGYVTSSCFSPTLGKSIALGIVQGGAARLGQAVYVYSNGITTEAKIVSPAHFDPKGERLNG